MHFICQFYWVIVLWQSRSHQHQPSSFRRCRSNSSLVYHFFDCYLLPLCLWMHFVLHHWLNRYCSALCLFVSYFVFVSLSLFSFCADKKVKLMSIAIFCYFLFLYMKLNISLEWKALFCLEFNWKLKIIQIRMVITNNKKSRPPIVLSELFYDNVFGMRNKQPIFYH